MKLLAYNGRAAGASARRLIAGPACTNVERVIRPIFLAVLGLASVAAACGQSVPGPQTVALGRSTCARCGHVISSLDAAAQIAYQDGTARLYDDIGCMATDPVARRGTGERYVQMAGGKGWARAEDVTFASPAGATSPQGYNYFAFPEEEARRLAPDHWARGWNDLVTELGRKR
jgi:hypothetical protein